jgi:hypothetical protein
MGSAALGRRRPRFLLKHRSIVPARTADDGTQLVQSGGDLALGAVTGGPVVVDLDHLVRWILLRHNAIRVITTAVTEGGDRHFSEIASRALSPPGRISE